MLLTVKQRFFEVFLLLVIALPVVWPTLQPGFFSVHDEAQHIVDIYEMFRAFQVQGFPPRWAPDLNFNLGYPYFSFYYNLPFYISTLFMHLGFTITESFKGIMLLSAVLGLSGFYLFIRAHLSRFAALAAAALYLYTPYYAVDLYVRGSVGELMVLSLLPWTAFAITKFLKNPKVINFVFASLTVALLSLSHNVLNVFTLPLIFLYGVVLVSQKGEFGKGLIKLIAVFLVAIALSCYYWLPAVYDIKYVSSYEQIKIEDQFPFFKQLLIPFWGYGTSRWGPGDEMSFQIGLLDLVAVGGSLFFFRSFNNRKKTLAAFFLGVFFLMIMLMNQRSLPFWNLSKFLRFVQFPWRMLIFTCFSSAFLAGLAVESFLDSLTRGRKVFYTALFVSVIILLNLRYFVPSEFKQASDENYLKRYFANRTLLGNGERAELSRDYLGFSEDFLPPTIWQSARPKELPKSLVTTAAPADIVYNENGLNFSVEANSLKENKLFVYVAYFPGWVAKVDGQPVEVKPATDFGLVSLNLPAGQHTVDIFFKETPIRKSADIVSLSALVLIIVLLVGGVRERPQNA